MDAKIQNSPNSSISIPGKPGKTMFMTSRNCLVLASILTSNIGGVLTPYLPPFTFSNTTEFLMKSCDIELSVHFR